MGSHPHTSTCKPIFTVELPRHIEFEKVSSLGKMLQEKLEDYHVLVFTGRSDKVEFSAFYPKDLDEKSFEELKEYVLTELKK